jgi:archaellum component FlaG (FlaF/FlaG flagellin family)
MGLSSLTAMVVLVFLAASMVFAMMMAYSDYNKSDLALKERERMLESQRRGSLMFVGFNSTNVTDKYLNVTLYIKNTGSQSVRTDCIDLYLDGGWVNGSNITETLHPDAFDPGLWKPFDILLVSSLQDIVVGEHNATVVSCAGIGAQGRFNASRCGDGRCEGGEYCELDNSSCLKNICHIPYCLMGCNESPIINDIDTGFCDSANHAGSCIGLPCQCGPSSVCCGLATANCNGDDNCCQGYLCVGGFCQGA